MKINHPAKYSQTILHVLRQALRDYPSVLDPFAGTGRLREVAAIPAMIEIEPEWAEIAGAVCGDCLKIMPTMPAGSFDAICTSPTYGNRMADTFTDHQPEKKYRRNTYRHVLGRPLTPGNSGGMQWGRDYQEFHLQAWEQTVRLLRPGGRFVLNVSDHVRNGKMIPVTAWHIETLLGLGLTIIDHIQVVTPRNGFGQNGKARAAFESVVIFENPRFS